MGAPLKLTPGQLRDLAQALDMLAEITKQTGVQFCAYGRLDVGIGDSTLEIQETDGVYVVEDRIGD